MKLSILIATVPERRVPLWHLRTELDKQAQGKPVEILEELTPRTHRGGPSIGAKRQTLLERAQGEYVVFIDDDDKVAPTYLEDILQAIEQKPDCIGFEIEVHGLSRKPQVASGSNRWEAWAEKVGGYDYVRTIYHKNPVRREIALQIGFKDMCFGEDHDYSQRLKASGLLKTEVYIPKRLYIYRYKHENPKTKYGMRA
jgi:glycosyltransferase involved in cell wall biosynthesis